MTRHPASLALLFAAIGTSPALAQSGEWTTTGFDAQRTAWVRADDRLTTATIEDGTFRFLWKMPFENRARDARALTPPVILDRLIGYRGFKALAFVGGAERVFAVDTDLARPYWMVQLNYMAATGGPPPVTAGCPGGLTAMPGRRTALVPSAFGRGGGGRGARSMSAVGEPGRGAAILSQPPRGRGAGGGGGGRGAGPARGATGRGPVPGVPFGGVDPLYVVGSDGFLHVLRTSDGADAEPAVPFLPPGARASALTFIEGAIFTTTSGGCAATANGVWAIDLTVPDRNVVHWQTGGPNIVGEAGLAFGGNGTVFVATGPALSPTGQQSVTATEAATRYANAVVALDPMTLAVKDWFSAPSGITFNTSPIVVRRDNRDLVAVAGDNGRLYVLDGSSLGGADHRTPLHVTAAYSEPGAGGSLATWEGADTEWILAPAVGRPTPGLAFTPNGSAPAGRIVAFRLTESGSRVTLEPGWASRDLPAPLGPIVINGVVFAADSGEYRGGPTTMPWAERARRSRRATLYALDGTTGRQLWSSGATVTSFAEGGLVAGAGQVYLVTHDSHLYAFGIPMEH